MVVMRCEGLGNEHEGLGKLAIVLLERLILLISFVPTRKIQTHSDGVWGIFLCYAMMRLQDYSTIYIRLGRAKYQSTFTATFTTY